MVASIVPRLFKREPLYGQALLHLGDQAQALNYIHQAVAEQPSGENLIALALAYVEHGNDEAAQSQVERALKKNPQRAIIHLVQAVLAWHQGEAAQAQTLLARAVRLDRQVVNHRDLQFDHFWGPRALAALEQMQVAKP